MTQVKINDSVLRKAAEAGMDEFVQAFVDAIRNALGGELNAQNMAELNSDQITLDKAFRNWGVAGLYKLINKAHKCYNLAHEDIERDMSDEEFMALYEKYPFFDDFDDDFVENEEQWTAQVACYIDEHIELFATVEEK